MKEILISIFVSLSLGVFGQGDWTPEDSIRGQRMVETIEQSLKLYYAEQSPNGN